MPNGPKVKPGFKVCRGCSRQRPLSDFGEIISEGRRPTISRCDDCMWRMMQAAGTPSPVAELKELMNVPPSQRRRATKPRQEQMNYGNN